MYEMKPEYYIGIEAIDKEHERLFAYAEELYQLLCEEFLSDKYDHVSEVLEKLKAYTIEHFAHEEEYMESIQYKKLFTQKIQHQQFKEKLEEIKINTMEEAQHQDELIKDTLEFLTDWLIHHILEVDMQIGK